MSLIVESARYYSYSEPDEPDTARLQLKSNMDSAVFRTKSKRWIVEGTGLLIPEMPATDAQAIKGGDPEVLSQYIEAIDEQGTYVAKRRIYVAEAVASILRLKLHLPDDGTITEYVPGENGVAGVRPLYDSRIYN